MSKNLSVSITLAGVSESAARYLAVRSKIDVRKVCRQIFATALREMVFEAGWPLDENGQLAPLPTKEILGRLSPRERQVATLIAQGRSNKEVGELMRISENTAKNHLHNIFYRIHLTRREELAFITPEADWYPAEITANGE